MKRNKIRIGIIGAGQNTQLKHIPNFKKIEGVEIVAVCNRSLESSRQVSDKFGIPKIYAHWTELIENNEIEAVLIGTWPYLHCPAACAALQAGKHVLCEARMAMNAQEAYEMWNTSKNHPELVAQIVPSPFTLKYDQHLFDLIQSGFLGEILTLDLRFSSRTFIDRDSALTWRQNYSYSGLNMLSLGIWYEALTRWVGEAKRVSAMTRIFVKQRKDVENGKKIHISIPDHVDVLAEMYCGAQAHFQFSAVKGFSPYENEIWIFGSEGTLHLDLGQGHLLGGRRGMTGLEKIEIPPSKIGQWRVEEEFINAIRGIEQIKLTTFEDGVKYMQFTEAVSLSAATGETIHLPLLNGAV